jgi:hypothetical protein
MALFNIRIESNKARQRPERATHLQRTVPQRPPLYTRAVFLSVLSDRTVGLVQKYRFSRVRVSACAFTLRTFPQVFKLICYICT